VGRILDWAKYYVDDLAMERTHPAEGVAQLPNVHQDGALASRRQCNICSAQEGCWR
jgi:hypothetical protein